MIITLRSLYFFAIVHVLAVSTILCTLDVDQEKRELSKRDLTVVDVYDTTTHFLAGDNTPVWTAYRADASENVTYTKLEDGIVKKAIDYWKSAEFSVSTATRVTKRISRSIDNDLRKVKHCHNSTENVTENVTEEGGKIVRNNKTLDWSKKVYHPTVLIVMDYKSDWPTDKRGQEKLIMDRILYALAFWQDVDIQLRHIEKPKVRLRIAGIVIGRNKMATPYVWDKTTGLGFSLSDGFYPMVDYWMYAVKPNFDLPFRAYDIVVTMTDSEPSLFSFPGESAAINSHGPRCDKDLAGIIMWDNLDFNRILGAVAATARILGATTDGKEGRCPSQSGEIMANRISSIGKKWLPCTLKDISETLQSEGRCMENPKEYYPPGKPAEVILPGKVATAKQQCLARRRDYDDECEQYRTCDYLYCAEQKWNSPCLQYGPPLDGTKCQNGKVCLDGKCVAERMEWFWKNELGVWTPFEGNPK